MTNRNRKLGRTIPVPNTEKSGLNFAASISKQKKFFAKTNDSTKKTDIKPLIDLVSEMTNKSTENAEKLIKYGSVTVNGNLVDNNYQLKSGDVIRVGIGHILNNSNFMVVIN
jgi:23S rRNA-/tRNA-specific pseudouridylate synthase